MLDRSALAALGVDDALIADRRRLDGERADSFLAALPELAARWQRQFGLAGARIVAGGALSAALSCERVGDGRRVMLKLSAPDAPDGRAEAVALALWGGDRACALLDRSDDATALLLATIEPGDAVQPSGDDGADVQSAARLLKTLHRPSADTAATAGIPDCTVELEWRFSRALRWIEEGRALTPVGPREVTHAYRAALALHETAARILCHGDFLNKNLLLDHRRRWWAVDPKPCLGDRCLDAAFWALHHRPGVAVRERCELIAGAAGMDLSRVWAWARAFAATEAVIDIGPGRAQGHLRTLRGDSDSDR